MIDSRTYTKEWIDTISAKNRNVDKILVEKVIRAITLLVSLKTTNLDFIFKGGTALMLMLPKPTRLSIDIDIIVPDKETKVENYLDQILQSGSFVRYELQNRYKQSNIVKAHYKFYYKPTIKTHSDEEYILLDILFENNPYSQLTQTAVQCPFVITTGETSVLTPTIENILGDKLTAFAPNTTGIPYFKGRNGMGMEIVKQLYDIGNLFDFANNLETVLHTFETNAAIELQYRSLSDKTPTDVLDDIFQTSFCISMRGISGTCNFGEIQQGINRIKSFIYSSKYLIEDVIVSAAKAAYLSALLKNQAKMPERYTSESQIEDFDIKNVQYNKFNKLKRNLGEAYFYWYKAFELLGLEK